MDGLQWKTLLKWMIWGVPLFSETPESLPNILTCACFQPETSHMGLAIRYQDDTRALNESWNPDILLNGHSPIK